MHEGNELNSRISIYEGNGLNSCISMHEGNDLNSRISMREGNKLNSRISIQCRSPKSAARIDHRGSICDCLHGVVLYHIYKIGEMALPGTQRFVGHTALPFYRTFLPAGCRK